MLSRTLIGILLLLTALGMRAQDPRQDDDFVKASLLTIGPGDDAVTCFGHAALRLQCPSHQLDYCFTFEMKLQEGEQMKFLTGEALAGFMVAQTDFFLQQYRQQGRSIREYDLNLTPQQEQELWKNLDHEVAQDARWSYDFITTNCGSMCVWIIEKSLCGYHIDYHQLPSLLTATYSEVMNHIAVDAPWLNLYFHLRYFGRRNDTGQLNDKMAPELLAEAWQHASFTDGQGNSRPVITATRELAPQTLQPQHCWLTPQVTFVLIILVLIIIIVLFIFKKRKRQ